MHDTHEAPGGSSHQNQLPRADFSTEGSSGLHHKEYGTIGGNLVTASPAGDTLPPLYVLRTKVELTTKDSSRVVALVISSKGRGQQFWLQGKSCRPFEFGKPLAFTSIFTKRSDSERHSLLPLPVWQGC